MSALESIRLDLLRLQMGSAPIASVTATLDAARQIGDRIGESIAANIEVDRMLASSRTLTGAIDALDAGLDDEDVDTPIHGVPVVQS